MARLVESGRTNHPAQLVSTLPIYRTQLGAAYGADALTILKVLPNGSVNAIITSPPYALHFKKEYGNVDKQSYVQWMLPFAREIKRVLKKDGSFVLNIGGSYDAGSPTRSLYHFKLLIALVEEIGFYLAQECFWHNPAKLPSPTGFNPSDVTDDDRKKAATILGGLLLGQVAEHAFEEIYRSEMGQDAEFKLVDQREGRTDTDYRVLNGRDRPIYRLNIKFFGSTFRRGLELVGLEPEDCFPLATYKIIGALDKTESGAPSVCFHRRWRSEPDGNFDPRLLRCRRYSDNGTHYKI